MILCCCCCFFHVETTLRLAISNSFTLWTNFKCRFAWIICAVTWDDDAVELFNLLLWLPYATRQTHANHPLQWFFKHTFCLAFCTNTILYSMRRTAIPMAKRKESHKHRWIVCRRKWNSKIATAISHNKTAKQIKNIILWKCFILQLCIENGEKYGGIIRARSLFLSHHIPPWIWSVRRFDLHFGVWSEIKCTQSAIKIEKKCRVRAHTFICFVILFQHIVQYDVQGIRHISFSFIVALSPLYH